jgi:hypothetical protein
MTMDREEWNITVEEAKTHKYLKSLKRNKRT